MIEQHKADMIAAIIDEFELNTIGYVGTDGEDFGKALLEKSGRELSPPEGEADICFIDEYGDDPVGVIGSIFQEVRPGGFICGSGYAHATKEIMEAVAEIFSLVLVQVGPAGVWAVRK